MLIETILDEKGRDCATIRPEAMVSAAVAILASRRIGAVVVEDLKGAIVGIFSERDLVRLLAKRGRDALDMKLREAMTSPVITCKPTDRLDKVLAIMNNRKVRHLPVVSNGSLAGMISIRDIARHQLSEKENEAAVLLDIARLHG
nr:CBS domain-containing protein [uncultured Lichenicoccus sp.]